MNIAAIIGISTYDREQQLHSRTEVILMRSIVSYFERDWDKYELLPSSVNWELVRVQWKDVVQKPSSLWGSSFEKLQDSARQYLEGLLPKSDASAEGAGKPSTDSAKGSS